MDFIRITALQDIGNNIAYSSLVPVVDMAGTPTTKKANLQIVANLVLSGAGGSYFAPAARAILAQSVTNAAQPNITSTGTLTSLTVSGNVNLGSVSNVRITGGTIGQVLTTNGNGALSWTTVSGGSSYGNSNVAAYLPTYTGNVGAGNVNATGTVYTSGISSTGLASLTILNVSTTANLGAVSNVRITGGSAGQKLTTDGAGNLSWTNDANSNYGNSNVAAYLPTYTGIVGANGLSSSGNITINANTGFGNWTFTDQGKLIWPGNIGLIDTNNSVFELHSTNGLQIHTNEGNASQSFLFATDGSVYCPANAYFEGTRLNVGPGAGNVPLATNPTLVVTDTGLEFIQAALINQSSNGSSDYAAYGADSDETQGFSDLGFAGHTFNDPNYTITEPGDGYVFSQGYANGIGGGLVLATGENGNVPDIVFATGGFLANAEFARIDHSANVFHLTRANSGIRFADGTTQTTAATGNIITVNLTGSNANVLYGNGVFAPVTGGGNVSELVNGNNSFVLDSAGNVVFEGTPSGNAVDRGLVWDYGANANGVNSQIRQDFNGLSVRAWTENGGGANGYSPPVNIITNQDAATKTWTFDGQGNLTVPSGSIKSISDAGDLRAYVTLTPDLGLARLAGRSSEYTENFNSGGWTSASYTGTQVDITDAPNLLGFVSNNTIFTSAVDRTFSINGGEPVPYTGYGASGNNVTLFTDITADPDPTVVTSIDFYYQSESSVAVDYDDGTLNINAAGLTINLDNDQTSGPDINLRSGDDILLQAKNKALGSESEGGDININAGDGAGDDGQGNTASTGGDIVVTAGDGGYGNGSGGAAGGFTRFQAGAGGDAGVSSAGGAGGFVEISAGNGGTNNGNAQLGAQGGYVDIYAGQTTLANGVGGNVSIRSGTAADGNGVAGNVQIITPISATANGGTWTFDGRGNLTLPNGTPFIKTVDETSTVTIRISGEANNRSQFQIGSDGGTDQFTYISSQNDTNGFASFGLNAYSGVPTSAVIGINNGTALDWTFTSAALDDTEAYLYTPAGATITTPNAPSGQTGKNIFIEAGSVDQENFNTNAGGELMLKGGRGGFNDGSGGGPGGNVNINAGESADPAGRAGNVNITAGALTNWTFDYTGNLILAGGSSMIQSIANSSLDPLNPNVSTMTLTPDSNYTSQALVLDPTAPGHIHLRAFASSNIDQPSANIFLGGEDTSFEITSGSNNQAVIHSGGNDWVFDSTGNLIVPGASGGVIKTVANGAIAIAAIDGGSNNPAQVISFNANGTPTTALSAYASEATIQANINGSIQTWAFTNAGVVTSPVLTYANLSAATTAGRRAFISDANLIAAGNFGNAVSGGGANTVPVYSDGSVWRIG